MQFLLCRIPNPCVPCKIERQDFGCLHSVYLVHRPSNRVRTARVCSKFFLSKIYTTATTLRLRFAMPSDIASPENEKRRRVNTMDLSSLPYSHNSLSDFQVSFSNQHPLPLSPVPLISVPPPDGSFLSLHHAPHGPNNGPRWTCGYCNNKFNNWAECLDHEENFQNIS